MSRYHSYISSAVKIIEAYDGAEPFAYSIKKYFAANKKYGSKDRKTISALCYDYFRAASTMKTQAISEKILLSFFLCEQKSSELLQLFHPGLDAQIQLPAKEKMALLGLDEAAVFPFCEAISPSIDKALFAGSFLQQPKLFLRVRPGKKKSVEDKLNAAAIAFEWKNENCIALENAVSLEKAIAINKDAVIQDYSSQQVLDYLDQSPRDTREVTKIAAWDCCAASGGKAILLHDKLKGKVQLTVSDVRKNILHNCQQRLQQAKVNIYKNFIADLTQKKVPGFDDVFSIVICDAPCTGSGTWSRTPEQLLYFKKETIGTYVQKQQKIATTALQHLSPGGLFFYITCSVFSKENEEVVDYLLKESNCSLLHQQYYKGYSVQADTMFVAVLTK